ncbi:MAG: hypothetical protein ACYCZ1_07250 [Candidatus Humimicrobiaceae bacterium]
MAGKNKNKMDIKWKEAKKKCRLNAETVQMAKELGLNPKSLIKNIPNKNQSWKKPVYLWIHEMYWERNDDNKKISGKTGKRNKDMEIVPFAMEK